MFEGKISLAKSRKFHLFLVLLLIGSLITLGFTIAFHPSSEADFYARRGMSRAALLQFEKPVKNPVYLNDPFLYLDHAVCLRNLDNHEEALVQLNKALKTEKEHPVYSRFLSLLRLQSIREKVDLEKGWNLCELRRYEDAISAFERVIEADRSNSRAYTGLAVVHAGKGDFDAAGKAFQKGIDLSRGSERERVLHERAKFYRDQGHIDAAIKDLNDAVSLSRCAFAHYDRALLYIRQEKLNDALSDLNTAIGISVREKFYHERALLRKRMNDLEGALKDIKRAADVGEPCRSLAKDREEIEELVGLKK